MCDLSPGAGGIVDRPTTVRLDELPAIFECGGSGRGSDRLASLGLMIRLALLSAPIQLASILAALLLTSVGLPVLARAGLTYGVWMLTAAILLLRARPAR